jgi:hypothetical protein
MSPETCTFYQITLKGELDPSWSDCLNGFEISAGTAADGTCITTLTGAIADQAALRGVLTRIWDLNLEVTAVNRVQERETIVEG